jgi:sugar phosphate isomerase/epimerase
VRRSFGAKSALLTYESSRGRTDPIAIKTTPLSLTSDYVTGLGCPESHLRRIAEAGFSHVHWCHQWNTDFIYSDPEIEQIQNWLGEFGLRLLDLHGSAGVEKKWLSAHEYERLAGVELVRNRIEMAARLSSDVVIMHAGGKPEWDSLRRSLDALEPLARNRNVRIAIENGDFDLIRQALAAYRPDYLGLCYDAGHGNIGAANGLAHLESLKDRLISVHLHDNDGTADQHRVPFTGTVNWQRLAGIIATSSYRKCVSLESMMLNAGNLEEGTFLASAHEAAARFAEMIGAHGKENSL